MARPRRRTRVSSVLSLLIFAVLGVGLYLLLDRAGFLSEPHNFRSAAQPPAQTDSVSVGFWNVENLFDSVDTPRKDDPVPTEAEVESQMAALAAGLRSLPDGPPDILGLCEVENLSVLETWVDKHLADLGYGSLVLIEGGDPRGIDTALISRFPIREAQSIELTRGSRHLLEVVLDIHGESWLVLVTHNKSRFGGVQETSAKRRRQTDLIEDHIDRRERNFDQIVLMGDFNDDPTDRSVRENLSESNDVSLVNLFDPAVTPQPPMTYIYQGTPFYYDQILVSCGLAESFCGEPVSGWTWDKGSLKAKGIGDDTVNWPSDHSLIWTRFVRESDN